MNIFPEITISEPDMIVVAECFSKPAVKKYLHMLAHSIGTDIVTGQKAPNQSAEDYLMIEANMKGQLAVIDTLLGIDAGEASPVAQ